MKREERSLFKFFPDRLRWILTVPSALTGLLSAYTIVAILRHSVDVKWEHSIFAQFCVGLFGSFLSAILFVNFGAVMAPCKKYFIARILALTFFCLTAAKIFDLWRWRLETDVPWFPVVAAGLTGIAAAFVSAFLYYQQEQYFRENQKRRYRIDSFERP